MTKEEFWKWFEEISDRFLMLEELDNSEKEELLSVFDKNLQAYCEGLSFEISKLSETGREITFSAEGDIDFFDSLIDLIDAVPEIDWWEFIPFIQAHGADLKVRYENLTFNTKDMYFLPMENEEEPTLMGIQVALSNYEPENEAQEIGVYVTLEAQIGEFDCATLLGYLELTSIPKDMENTDFVSLLEFPHFVEWFKEKHNLNK